MKSFSALLSSLMVVLCFLVTLPKTSAQTVNGTLLGTVVDEQGAVLPNAPVTARNVGTGATRSVVTDARGAYRIASVPAGSYDVTVSAPGFKSAIRNATMTVGAAVRVDFTLAVGAVSERVEVTGEAPQVDTTTSTMAGLMPETTIRELPLNGRDWLQLGALQPGVLIGLSQNPDHGENVTHGGGMFLSISGGRPTSNVFMVDGLVINDEANKSPGSALGVNLGVDAIREFSILTSTYSAEFGRSSGGVINSITKSGTNAIHGSAFYFVRNSALDARNFFDPHTIPPFRRHQFGGSIGGPIKKDKLFYFANYEGLRQFLSESFSSPTLSNNARNGILTSGTVTMDPRVKPYLAMFPLPNGPVAGDVGQYVFGAGQLGNEDYTIGRVDYTLGANNSFFGSYMFDRSKVTTPDLYNHKLVGDRARNQRVILSFQHVFSPKLLNTLNAGFARDVATGNIDVPGSGTIPAVTDKSLGYLPGQNPGTITIAELASLQSAVPGGVGATGGDQLWWSDPQVNDTLVWVKGRNNIRMGFSVEAIRDNLDVGHNPLGDWQFASIHDFLTGVPSQFAAALPGLGTYRGIREKIFGVYVQEDLRLRSNLTLNLGVRYEPTTTLSEVNGLAANIKVLSNPQISTGNPMYQNPTLGNVAPRVGLAWDPTKTGKTSIRAGFGIFDIEPLPNLLSGNINHTYPFNENGQLVNPPASTFPNGAGGLLGATGLSGYHMQPNPPVAYKEQWNLNIEHQITSNLSITAGYVGSRGVHLPIRYGDTDVVPQYLVTIGPLGNLMFPTNPNLPKGGPIQRINPNPIFGIIPATEWNGYSIYHAFQFNVAQRFSHGFTFQAVYVWSKNIDVGSSEVNQSDNFNNVDNPYPLNPNLNRGVADWDVPQHLALNFLWDTPNPSTHSLVPRFLLSGWELGGIFTAQTGEPFSAKITVDQARTGNGAGSNAGYRPNYNPAGCTAGFVNPGNPSNYINLSCFSFPALGQLGNIGRNTMRAPGVEDFDFSLFKNHNLLGERLKVQFRAEFFNLLNRTNFGARWLVPLTGQVALAPQVKQVPANAALKAPTVTTSRQIQFGMKFVW